MSEFCPNPNCPACKVKATILDLKEEGLPDELIIRLVVDVMSSVLDETILVAEELGSAEYGVVH